MKILRYRHRIVLLTIITLVGNGVLLSRLHTYQITRKDEFLEQLPKNHEVVIREPGIRGEIKDRNGRVLANNQRNYEITFNLKEVYTTYQDDFKKNKYEGEDHLTDISDIVNTYLRPQLRKFGLDREEEHIQGLKAHYNTHGGLIPFTFRSDLSYDQFSVAVENNISLPGVYTSVRPQRLYPYGSLGSHILGYVQQWSKGDIPDGFKHYVGDNKGMSGVELTMDESLRGTEGVKTVLRNNKGKTLRLVDNKLHGPGAEISLTIDSELQYLTEKTLRIVGRAAAVVMDPNTGEILAMASTPDYDPNDYIPSIHPRIEKFYTSNKARPFNNAAIQNFTPGSTFKLPTALSACMNGKAGFNHNCNGYIEYGKLKIRCWKTYGHGDLAMSEAIQRSCNPYFMQLAASIGAEQMVEDFKKLGLGVKSGVRLPSESAGIIPGSIPWRRTDRKRRLTPAISGMTTIGQSDSETTPLQMAALVSAIANKGKLYTPKIVKDISHPDKVIAFPKRARLKLDLLRAGISIENLELIRNGMRMAANNKGGTAGGAALEEYEVAAKTGTAQTTDHGLKTNIAWTVGFAPYDSPRYVVAVAVRRGTSGGKVAGPLLRLILEGAFAKENGYKIPLKRLSPAVGNFDIINEVKIPKKHALDILFERPFPINEESPEENEIFVVHPEPEEDEESNQ